MSFFIPYKCPPSNSFAERLDFAADNILANYLSNHNDNYAKLSEWSLKLFQINIVPQFELNSKTVKVPDDIEVEPLSEEEMIYVASALDKGKFDEGIYSLLDRVPGLEYQKINKKIIGVEVSIPGSVNEQQEFIDLFYPHDPEIKLTDDELRKALTRFNSEDARLIAHYSGLLLRRLHINDRANFDNEVDNWLEKIMQANDVYDTLRIANVWVTEYNLRFDPKNLKNFKTFFDKYGKLIGDYSDNVTNITKNELKKFQSKTYKRLSNIISPTASKPAKSIEPSQYYYKFCSEGNGLYYIQRYRLPWYTRLWTWFKNWF